MHPQQVTHVFSAYSGRPAKDAAQEFRRKMSVQLHLAHRWAMRQRRLGRTHGPEAFLRLHAVRFAQHWAAGRYGRA